MVMNIAVGVMAAIVVAASAWCWWLDRQGNEDDAETDKIEKTEEKHS